MNVSKIELTDFMSHTKSVATLPAKGLVLVTGANGSGKSSLVEAVAWGCWGETLRGTNPAPCEVALRGPGSFHVERSRKTASSRTNLNWTDELGSRLDWESPAESQKGLVRAIGEFDVWRRTCVFSSQDASHFTTSTDAVRKRLLEELLGLDRFDTALLACRAELKEAREKANNRGITVRSLQLSLAASKERLDDTTRTLESLPPVSDKSIDSANELTALQELRELRDTLQQELADDQSRVSKVDEAWGAAAQELHTLQVDLAHMQQSPVCKNCGQAWPDAAARAARIEDLKTEISALSPTVKKYDRTAIMAKSNALQVQINNVVVKGMSLRAALSERERLKKTRDDLRERGVGILDQITSLEEEIDRTTAELVASETAVAELEAVEKALGTKGVRAHILGASLAGLEQLANQWLDVLTGPGMRVKLRSYQEKKSGGYTESLSLDVTGAGGGHGYPGASGGERRRIDVAMLLALAEVSAAAFNRTPGTLFFDEVFDSLDREGTNAVISALNLLAQDRAVVVISHSDDLIAAVDCVTHLHVANGQMRTL